MQKEMKNKKLKAWKKFDKIKINKEKKNRKKWKNKKK